jgi:hypothetical protein
MMARFRAPTLPVMNLPGSVPDPEDRGRITNRNVRGSDDLIGMAVMAEPVHMGVVMAEPAVPMGAFAAYNSSSGCHRQNCTDNCNQCSYCKKMGHPATKCRNNPANQGAPHQGGGRGGGSGKGGGKSGGKGGKGGRG